MNEKLLLPARLINTIFVMFVISYIFSNLFIKKDPLSIIILSTVMVLVSSLVTLTFKFIFKSLMKNDGSEKVALLDASGAVLPTKDDKLASKIIAGASIPIINFFAFFFLFNFSGIINVGFITFIALYLFLVSASIPLMLVISIIIKAGKK
jgi:hypothetical protein